MYDGAPITTSLQSNLYKQLDDVSSALVNAEPSPHVLYQPHHNLRYVVCVREIAMSRKKHLGSSMSLLKQPPRLTRRYPRQGAASS